VDKAVAIANVRRLHWTGSSAAATGRTDWKQHYSPGEDSVVRRQAFSLRQKLQEYYASEGARDLVRIDLPLGRYVPTFSSGASLRQPTPAEPTAVVITPGTIEAPSRPEAMVTRAITRPAVPARVLAAALAVVASLLATGWTLGIRCVRTPLDRALTELWGPWLTDPQGAVISSVIRPQP
jgi:hypothetical protein